MRRLATGAALTIVGVLAILFAPAGGVGQCVDCIRDFDNPICGCHTFTNSLAIPITWTGYWDKLFFPMAIPGLALTVTGIVLLVRGRRSRIVGGSSLFGLGLVGILYAVLTNPVGSVLVLSCAVVALGLGVLAVAYARSR